MSEHIRFVGEQRARLGESPVWDGAHGHLWFVDSIGGRVAACDERGMTRADWSFEGTIGSIGLAGNGLVAAMEDGFHRIDMNGRARPLAYVGGGPTLRFNDGKMDRVGRFLAGQLERSPGPTPTAALWRLDANGITRLEGGLRLVNAICFSPAGDTLYFADSLEGTIRIHDYGLDGMPGVRRGTIDCRPWGSGPDGATVDRDGNLWVALVLAQCIVCVSPDGRLLRRVELPIPYPACPAFGGPDLATLFVTTIADSGHRLRSDHPDAGRLIAIEGLGVRGVAEACWSSHA